ncbi:VWA domain-containing protein [Streptomyces sp. NPDC051976]|uniref:VWA domain-containing protein n=1 Tax=Streptomyces sp. NPDC051976 TaxID=3154947 RepID=UPI003422F985
MQTVLRKGENAAVTGGSVGLSVAATGVSVDVSALLLGSDGKVRGDEDLVFYNHPQQDGVFVSGTAVSVDLARLPHAVTSVVIAASVDPLQPGAVFTRAPRLTFTQPGAPAMAFSAPDFADAETLVVLAELYRRGEGWRVRAVGQGYASGLAGLATDYGVSVDPDPAAGPASGVPRAPHGSGRPGTAVGLVKVERSAPGLVAPVRQASQALADRGIAGGRAAVYLLLDHDYYMEDLYESFAVQAFAERVLALSVNLDDDGTVPVIFSGADEPFLEEISLDNYRGRIGQLHTQVDWGWGNVAAAMRCAVAHYQDSAATDPAFVVVQVGREPWDKAAFRALLQNTAGLGVFWLFVGFGRGKLAFYKNLNASASARFSNVAFYDASTNPGAVPGDRFYNGLVDAFAAWTRR